jgi:L-2-hydroxyglutarate oxidase LhgO
MDATDAVVVGAGVLGLAVARALARDALETVVLEREPGIGAGISSRNSEVIHAGVYYATGSLKARFCVEGNRRLYAYCLDRGIGHWRCGKLIVATEPAQLAQLESIGARAQANGAVALRLLSGSEARALEPALACEAALLSPSTGILDSHAFMLSLQGDLESHGGVVALRTVLQRARRVADGFELALADGTRLHTRYLVNAAGLNAPALALRIDGLDPGHVPAAHFAKGHYFALAGRCPFRRLIYPVPEEAGLGVHLTLDLGGQAKFGPDVMWVDDPDDFSVDAGRADAFYAQVRRYWPGLSDAALVPAYAGIRPKIQARGEAARDFLVQGPPAHGVPGLVNLFGIESPGLTSSLALADHVVNLLRGEAAARGP